MSESQTLKELFEDIINKAGPYSQDPLQHAENVMESSSKKATEIKKRIIEVFKDIQREGENGEASDCASTAKYMLKDLGEKVEE